jgi:N-acetylglucosamine-6-phosphate deacetylase
MRVTARHHEDGRWVELVVRGTTIESIVAVEGPATARPDDDWIAPAFWDIQINGRWGHSFSGPTLTPKRVAEIIRAQAPLGTARVCPTLITAPVPDLLHGLQTIAAACEQMPEIASRIVGIHLEGPFISHLDGYRGAHPVEAIRDPDWDLFQRLQEASGGRIVLITLAPERSGASRFIEKASKSGIVVAIGHTAASSGTIASAELNGARLSTHLGNGIAATLPRHPNPIWAQAACDKLSASFIADGHHLDWTTLRVLTRAKGPSRTILISDASPLAGLRPGRYGDWAVERTGKVVVAGTPYLAGSTQGLEAGVQRTLLATRWGLSQVLATVTSNPAQLLGRPQPSLAPGEPANFIVFRRNGHDMLPDEDGFDLKGACVDGAWTKAPPS